MNARILCALALAVFAFATPKCASALEPQSTDGGQAFPILRGCDIEHGILAADFAPGPGTYAQFSVVFEVRGSRGQRTFDEVIPITRTDVLLRVYAEPIGGAITASSKVRCYLSKYLSNEPLTASQNCRPPVVTDSGVGITVQAVEIAEKKVFVRIVAGLVMLGAADVENFSGQTLYLKNSDGGARSDVALSGLAPQALIVAVDYPRNRDATLEMGVGEVASLDICLARAPSSP